MSPSISAPSRVTPRRMSATKGSGSTGRSASSEAGDTPFTSASYNSDMARSRASRPAAPSELTGAPGAGYVLAAAGVDLDPVAGVDEQRHLHHVPGLQGGGIAGAADPVALDARLG